MTDLPDDMGYTPAADRYEGGMRFRRVGRSGLALPAVSLGLGHNFGDDTALDTQRAILRRAFDRGVTHVDLGNNYGPPRGSAERNLARLLTTDFRGHRDELVISTKAGRDMWPGPYGTGGSRKSIVASCEQSLRRLGLDYVDIFYSHQFDPETPLEETLGALDSLVRAGKCLYVGISSYSSAQTRQAAAVLRDLGTPLTIHQPIYSILDRHLERDRLLDTLAESGSGCIVFSPLAQGVLTNRYLDGIPQGSRATQGKSLDPTLLEGGALRHIAALQDLAAARNQTLAQTALAWALRDSRVTSVLVGASSVAQLDDSLDALDRPDFTADELHLVDDHAARSGLTR